jgi:hypothetical protein
MQSSTEQYPQLYRRRCRIRGTQSPIQSVRLVTLMVLYGMIMVPVTQPLISMCLHVHTVLFADRKAAVLRNRHCGVLLIHKNVCRQTSLNKQQRSSTNRPRLARRSAIVHKHVKAAAVVKVACALFIASFPTAPPGQEGMPIIEVWRQMYAAVALRLGSS